MTTREALKILKEQYELAETYMGKGDGSVSIYVTMREEKLKALGVAVKAFEDLLRDGTFPRDEDTATATQIFYSEWLYGWECSKCKGRMFGKTPKYCPHCGRKFTRIHWEEEQ